MKIRTLVLALCFTTTPMVARADKALDQQLDRQEEAEKSAAKAAYGLGKYEESLDHYQKAYRIRQAPKYLFNIAQAYRQIFLKTGQPEALDEALEKYRSFARQAENPDERQLAEGFIENLELSKQKVQAERAAKLKAEREQLVTTTTGIAALRLAEDYLKQGDLTAVETLLGRFLRTAGNQRIDVVRAYQLGANLELAKKNPDGAQVAFARALSLDPSIVIPPEASAQTKSLFSAAREQLGASKRLEVSHTPPPLIRLGVPVTLSFAISADPMHMLSGMNVYYRSSGRGAYSRVSSQQIGKVTLPADFSGALRYGARLEYYVEAVDENAAVLHNIGTETNPIVAEVEAQPTAKVYKKWWFWTALVGAAAVAGGAIALGVVLSQPEPPVSVPINTGALRIP